MDDDTYSNRQLIYSLQNDPDNVFKISSRGIVIVEQPKLINRKLSPQYSLIVTASDRGKPSLTTTTMLNIVILSTKDTPPQFDKLGYLFNITENNKIGEVIDKIKITATENLRGKSIQTMILNDERNAFSIDNNQEIKVVIYALLASFNFFLFLTFHLHVL